MGGKLRLGRGSEWILFEAGMERSTGLLLPCLDDLVQEMEGDSLAPATDVHSLAGSEGPLRFPGTYRNKPGTKVGTERRW